MSNEQKEPAGMKVSHRLPPLPARVACDVLEELRKCYKSRNFGMMKVLIEELQAMCDRMENALYEYHDAYGGSLHGNHSKVEELKSEKRKLRGEVFTLKTEIAELKEQKESDTDDLEAVGSDLIHLMRDKLEIPIGVAGAFFKDMRKAGLIIYRQKE